MRSRVVLSVYVCIISMALLAGPGCTTAAAAVVQGLMRGVVYIDAQPGERVTVDWAAPRWAKYDNSIYLQAPDGRLMSRLDLPGSAAAGGQSYTLDRGAGTYRLETDFETRAHTVTSKSASLLVEPIKVAPSFVPGPAGLSYWFQLPAGAEQATLSALASTGTAVVRVYAPNGTQIKELRLQDSDKGGLNAVQQVKLDSSQPGVWRVELSAAGNIKVGVWLDGIPNLFSPQPDVWFTPEWREAQTAITVDATAVRGRRGLVGGGRLGESLKETANPTAVRQAYLDIGLQATELGINHNWSEPTNDNADPRQLNMLAFRWTDQYPLVLAAGVKPILYTTGPDRSWIGGTKNGSKLDNPALAAEWAEFVLASVVYANTVLKIGAEYISPLDEPNLNGISASGYARLLNLCREYLDAHPDERVRSVKLYTRLSGFEADTRSYLEIVLKEAGKSIGALGVHPWMYGYAGYGSTSSTWRYSSVASYLLEKAKEYNLPGEEPFPLLITEVNERSGFANFQNKPWLDSHNHSIWAASLLVHWLGTGHNAFLNIYPFAENGTIHHWRSMVYTDGRWKPVAHAVQLFMHSVQEQIVTATSDHWELEAMASTDEAGSILNVMVVNKAPRAQTATITAQLPAGLRNKPLQAEVQLLSPPGTEKRTYTASLGAAEAALSWTLDVPADTIGSITIQAVR